MPYPQDSSENHDLLPDSAHKFDMNVGLGDMLSLHTEVPESWNYLDESANQDSMSSSAKPQPDPTSNRPDLYNDSLANDNSNYNGQKQTNKIAEGFWGDLVDGPRDSRHRIGLGGFVELSPRIHWIRHVCQTIQLGRVDGLDAFVGTNGHPADLVCWN
ncbi:hypothetical protein AYI68_g3716 [Smittium mucronatum]|uniref:Uncharacterized protein n=1 Tax=Smittium mucronatum TaxID=133383 RepID=A0A1R0GZ45_9FUNG|nr:hypothetical protein AYI68_g3716 [Smittium mucronatum]